MTGMDDANHRLAVATSVQIHLFAMEPEVQFCPHCKTEMTPWAPPPNSSWGQITMLVCFNNDCPYYVRGWNWMKEQYDVVASYRHCFDPERGTSGPLPVWSPTAHRNAIVKE
jgi:hypothetical protein